MSKFEKRLLFVQDAIYNDVLVHKTGDKTIVDNSLGMADRWIMRGVAIPIEKEVEVVVPEEKPVYKSKSK